MFGFFKKNRSSLFLASSVAEKCRQVGVFFSLYCMSRLTWADLQKLKLQTSYQFLVKHCMLESTASLHTSMQCPTKILMTEILPKPLLGQARNNYLGLEI